MMPRGSPMRSRRQLLSALLLVVGLLCEPALGSQDPQQVPSVSSATQNSQSRQAKPTCTDSGTYVNSKGQTVRRPENCTKPPQGATAQCRDGTYSFSQSRRGTCSHHGGVARWLP